MNYWIVVEFYELLHYRLDYSLEIYLFNSTKPLVLLDYVFDKSIDCCDSFYSF